MPELPCRAPTRGDNKSPVIVVSGPPGSGKSTYARLLSQDFCLRYTTTGSIFRRMAEERGLSLEELSRLAERDPSIDLLIDKTTLELASKGGYVIDSHLAAWVLSDIADVSILVTAPFPVRAERIARREERSIDDVIVETGAREASQWERFDRYYGYDTTLYSSFDIVVDTSVLGIDEVYSVIKAFVLYKLKGLGYELGSDSI